jgi:hypothetical protein
LFAYFVVAPIYGQDRETTRFSNRIEEIAREYYRINDYNRALEGYLILDSIHPGNTIYNYRIGICYLYSNRKSNAYPYLEFAYNQEDGPENILFDLARAYHFGMEFEKAIISYESYKKQIQFQSLKTKSTDIELSELNQYIQMCRNGLRLIKSPISGIQVKNLGATINSEYDDFGPLVNKNEDLLIFTSKRKAKKNAKSDPLTGQYFERIFYSNKSGEIWTSAQGIGPLINQHHIHNAAVGLNPQGSLLFIYKGDDNRLSSKIAGDLYTSSNSNGQWGKPEPMPIINSKSWESSASITEDGTLLVFSSDRPGGFGGTDLYYSRKKLDGDWTVPENIGGYINTKFDEDGPFIHPEGNKLYFSSKGHNTMGGYDIFYSEFLDDKNRWTRPQNLGYPVNTPDDDIFFVWSVDGERAYFSSERADTYGNTDIYIMIRNDQEQVLVNASGTIRDKIDQSPVAAEIIVRELISNNLIGIFDTDNSGSFSVALNSGRKYRFVIKAGGYRDEMIQFDIPGQPDDRDLIKNVTLTRKK